MISQDKPSLGARIAQRFETSIDFRVFIAFNLFCAGWMAWQEWAPTWAFDPYPYEMLNMFVGLFMADVAILISVSQNSAKRAADKANQYMLEVLESNLSMLKTLRDMQAREEERDAVLHEMVRRGAALEEWHGEIRDAE